MLQGIRQIFGGSGAPTVPLKSRQLYFDTVAQVLYIGTDETVEGNSVIGVAGFVGITLVKQNAGGFKTYPTLQEAEDAANLGDTLIINSGTYHLGTDSLVLKNGVHKQFMTGVSIISDNINGTLVDNGQFVSQQWTGKPFIANTTNITFLSQINLSNSQSNIQGFSWNYDAIYENSPSATLTHLTTVQSDILFLPFIDFSNVSTGVYNSTFPLFTPSKTHIEFILHETNKIGNEYVEGYIGSAGSESGKIVLLVYDNGIPSNSTGIQVRFRLIIKP